MPISEATRADAQRLVERYPLARSALLPLLHLVQADEGFVSEDGIAFCAEVLSLTKAEVGAVATFYTMYKREPVGDYLLSVCTNPTCKVAGGQAIYEAYVDACGGHVDADAGVMVEHAECLAICDAAPVVQVNYEMYGPVTHDEAMDLLSKAKAGEPPASNVSGEVPRTFREVERELSGIEDGVDEQLIEAARLQATAANAPAYRSGETDIPVTHPGGDPRGHGGVAFLDAAGFSPPPVSADGEVRDDAALDTSSADDDREVVEQVAREGSGVEQELATQATDDQPTAGSSPPVKDQPTQEPRPDTPAEATSAPGAGSEAEPGDSPPGHAGDAGDPGDETSATDDDAPNVGRG